MREEINKYLKKYPTRTSDRDIIGCLLAKYGLKNEDSELYSFSDKEKQFIIQKCSDKEYLFPPQLKKDEYCAIAAKICSYSQLDELERLAENCDEKIKKLVMKFVSSIRDSETAMVKAVNNADDDISEKCTDTFVKAMEMNLKKLLEMSMNRDDEYWCRIGQLICQYLKQLGFYTPDDIKNSIRSEYVSTKNSYQCSTGESAQNGKIKQFCSLPYCIGYYDDEDDEDGIRCIEGICYYYKYEE